MGKITAEEFLVWKVYVFKNHSAGIQSDDFFIVSDVIKDCRLGKSRIWGVVKTVALSIDKVSIFVKG